MVKYKYSTIKIVYLLFNIYNRAKISLYVITNILQFKLYTTCLK